MGVYIKNMKMPKEGIYLATIDVSDVSDDGYAMINIPHVGSFIMAEVKEPHGPLIDVDELSKRQIDYTMSGHANSAEDCKEFGMMIITAPTVIDAENEDEES